MSPPSTVLVYLDSIGVPSEVSFLRRFYIGFEKLAPVWVGWHRDRDAASLVERQIILGRQGPGGLADRLLFKTIGTVPRSPDLTELSPRIIHAHFGRGGALALPVARALKIPLVVTFHGGDATKEKHYRRRFVSTIYQRRMEALQEYASGFHCVSEYIRDTLLRRGFPAEKLFVVRTGVEASPPETTSLPPHAEPYILFVGRLVEKKGVTHLIDAMHRIQDRGQSIPLVLIGDGPLADSLKKQAGGLKHVSFLGWRPNAEVRQWMRGALAVCVPSLMAESGDSEGLGHVVLEAMDAGVPVVASRHGGIGEVVEHGVTGLLTAPGDAAAIAGALETLILNPQTRQAYGDSGHVVIRRDFDAVTQSSALERRFLTLLSPHPSSPHR